MHPCPPPPFPSLGWFLATLHCLNPLSIRPSYCAASCSREPCLSSVCAQDSSRSTRPTLSHVTDRQQLNCPRPPSHVPRLAVPTRHDVLRPRNRNRHGSAPLGRHPVVGLHAGAGQRSRGARGRAPELCSGPSDCQAAPVCGTSDACPAVETAPFHTLGQTLLSVFDRAQVELK